jgi:polyphosphate kinase 2 (PPK2 family)
MDQPPAPKALTPAVQLADQAPIIAPDVSGDGEGLTGPRRFPAVSNDAIRQVFESGKYPYARLLGRAPYEAEKARLQAELLKVQIWAQETGQKFVILMEGRDAAGKGGTIKRFMEHLNPRYARVYALTKPSDVEKGQWFFQRYIAHLPTAGEMVFTTGLGTTAPGLSG